MKALSLSAIMVMIALPCLSQSLEWIDRISVLYPSKLYLTAMGVGLTKEAADNEAYKGISRIFKAEVRSVTWQVEEYHQGSDSRSESSFSFDESINIKTSSVLESVTIAKHGYDEEKDRYYSLAVLDKREYSEILTNRLVELSGHLEKTLAAIEEPEESHFLRLRTLLRARILTREIRDAYQMLVIAGGQSMVTLPEITIHDVDKMLAEFTMKDLKIGIRVEGVLADEIGDILIDEMNQNSLILSNDPGGNTSDLLFDCRMKVHESRGRADRRFTALKWTFSIKLKDLATGNVIYSDYISGENSSNNYEMALDRVLYAFEEKRVHEIVTKINRFFYED